MKNLQAIRRVLYVPMGLNLLVMVAKLAGWVVSMHCLLDKHLTLREAHAISGRIEKRLRDAVPRLDQVLVHTEPLTVVGESLS